MQRKHPQFIVRYHEHDLLLENVQEEEMNEEEKQLAWKSYEEEKERSVNRWRKLLSTNYTVYSKGIEFPRDVTLRDPV